MVARARVFFAFATLLLLVAASPALAEHSRSAAGKAPPSKPSPRFTSAVAHPHDAEYFIHLNDYPEDDDLFWGDDNSLTNGITHDDGYWYITMLGTCNVEDIINPLSDCFGLTVPGTANGDWAIKKIPATRDLRADYSEPPDAITKRGDAPALDEAGYWHAGDLDHYKYGNVDYLVVPFEPANSTHGAAIGVFRCSDLHFIAYAPIPHIDDGIGWCAISPANGHLYTSNDGADAIFEYRIDWHQLETDGTLSLEFLTEHALLDISDGTFIHDMQGGEFSKYGELLYVSCGIIDCEKHEEWPTDGIHVFETATWHEVGRSINQARGGTGCFDFTFDNTKNDYVPLSGCLTEEPEGLTVWDLDDVPGHDSHVGGQLHVLLYDHNFSTLGLNPSTITLKHYGTVRVDAGSDITVECDGTDGQSIPLACTARATGACGPVTLAWAADGVTFDDPTSATPTGRFTEGTHVVTVTATEGPSNSTDMVLVRVIDTTPPSLSPKPDIVLWPPNHDVRRFEVARDLAMVTDICDGSPSIAILSVTVNEPEGSAGTGSTTHDVRISCPDVVDLRAERAGSGNGRVYTIAYEAVDRAGNRSTAVSHVRVPHDRGSNRTADDVVAYAVRPACDRAVTRTVPPLERRAIYGPGAVSLRIRPSPSPGTTEIWFELAKTEFVRLRVFDVRGAEVAMLSAQTLQAGPHAFTWNGRSCNSGIYYCRFEAGTRTQTTKLLLLK